MPQTDEASRNHAAEVLECLENLVEAYDTLPQCAQATLPGELDNDAIWFAARNAVKKAKQTPSDAPCPCMECVQHKARIGRLREALKSLLRDTGNAVFAASDSEVRAAEAVLLVDETA